MNNYLEKIENFYDSIASDRDRWKQKNHYYYKSLESLYQFLIPKNASVLEIGSGTGDLLASLKPQRGVGIDLSKKMTDLAKKKYSKLMFKKGFAENLDLNEKFGYVILSDLIGNLHDVQKVFEELHKVIDERSRVVIACYNYLWEPILAFGEKIGLRMPQLTQNWLSQKDIENLLDLANFEIIKKDKAILIPIFIPFLSAFANKIIAKLPFFRNICLVHYFVAKQKPNPYSNKEYSVSVIIPARNEEGNIEQAVLRTPKLGSSTELIFVEGHSKDNTKGEIERLIEKYKGKRNLMLINQGDGVGKGDAVRKGLTKATGDILMILDADLTAPPEDLPKFYQLLRTKKAEYVQGSRLVYPMEKQAMRILNAIGNKFFGIAFSWILNQPIKDTLCGTKALYREDYEKIARNRFYFGDFDPFGDFDLILGASKLNLKIMEIPIRYQARTYGTTNISRFKHGWLLLKMTLFAAKKLKFV